MSAARTRLSVDLGTLRTSAALQQGDATPAVVALGVSGATSSTVAVDGGRVVIGDAAEAVIAAHPERGVRELQRRFGDTTPVVLDGQAYTADALTADVLTAVTAAAGVDPATTTLVLTHPAGWHEYKRELLAATGTRAGFAEVETISEPEAAVRPFIASGRLVTGSTVAVYDLGGTFEASIVGVTDSGVRVLGQPQTLERLGGDVLDQVVFRHVTEALGGTLQQLDRSDPAVRNAIAALRTECTAAKERLSRDGETSVAVMAPGLDTRVRITRDEFETAVRPLVNDTLAALERAAASAGIAATDLTAVVLAGGGAQIPVVAEMVAGHIGRPLLVDSPATVVALGAITSTATAAAAAPATPTPTPASADPTPTSDSPTIASAPRETAMTDQPASETPAPAAAGGAGGRAIPTPPPPPGKKVSSKVTTVVGGLAAVAAAITAAVFYSDDVVDAFDGPNGDTNTDGIAQAAGPETRTADRAERDAGDDDSMDAFDTVDPSAGLAAAAPPAAAAVGTPLAPPPADQPSVDRPAPRAAHQQQSQREQFDDDGPAPAPRHAPAAAAAGATAAGAAMASAAGADTSSDFEASRAQLLARLDAFEAPEGTSPEDAAALKAELRETIESFEPRPGQSTADAMAQLRDDFDDTVQDFTQDQRIDALVEEAERDNEADAADDSAPADPLAPPADDADDTATDDTASDDAPTDDAPAETDDASTGVSTDDSTADDGTAADADPVVDDGAVSDEGVSDTEVAPVEEPGDGDGSPFASALTDEVEGEGFRVDPTLLAEVDGESQDDRHRGEIDLAASDDLEIDVRPEVVAGIRDIDPTIGDAPVAEDPDAGGEITSRFSDGFDDLIQVSVISDPDDGGEATPGTVIGGDAVPQVRATVMPGADRPTMMDDLGDDTYQQVVAATEVDPAGILIGMDQGDLATPVVPIVDDLPLPDPAIAAPLEEAVVIIPEPIVPDIDVPISASDDSDFADDAPGFAEDLHSDITPDAPDNLQFGG